MTADNLGLHTVVKTPAMDPRTVRVRAQLFAAAEMLGETGEPFTVSALVRQARVSRSVFYVHFEDISSFAVELQRMHFEEIAEIALAERSDDPERAMLQAQRRLAHHFLAQQPLYRAVLALPSHGGMADAIATAISAALHTHFTATGTLPSNLDAELTASYISHAVAGLLTQWILGQHEADEESIAQHLFRLMPPWMYATERTSPDTQATANTEETS